MVLFIYFYTFYESYFFPGQTPVPPRLWLWILDLSHDPFWAIWLAEVTKSHQHHDRIGHPTCYNPNGAPSTIDYMLLSSPALSMVRSFAVNDLTTASIHCSLSLRLKTSFFKAIESQQSVTQQLPKFYWHAGDDDKFLGALNSPGIMDELKNLESSLSSSIITGDDIDSNAANFNEIIKKSAIQAGIKLRQSKKMSKATKV